MAKDKDQSLEELIRQQAATIARLEATLNERASDPGVEAIKTLAERSAPKDNPNYSERGPFTYPEGERVRPKPKLKRDVFIGGVRQHWTQLTPFEVELFNQFEGTRTARGGQWKAEVRMNGSQQELHIDLPMRTWDERASLPQELPTLLEILLHGEIKRTEAEERKALREEIDELKRQLAAA